MIDIENVKKEFNNYASNYSSDNERIALKIAHIARVAELSKKIAKNLNLTDDEIVLAQAIGYFHDIGRFEQVRRTNTFSDKESGINHGELGVQILSENDFIRKFISDDSYDNIIKTAILNHNRPQIDANLSGKELLFSKIIRDADKIDILYHIGTSLNTMESIFWYDDFDIPKINDDLINELKKTHYISYSKVQNNADVILSFYAYIFDLNFKYSLKIISENKYLEKFANRILTTFKSPIIKEQLEDLLNFCNEYINKNSV